MRSFFGTMDDIFMPLKSLFYTISFYLINFIFNCCLKFDFGCFNFFVISFFHSSFQPFIKMM